MSRPAWTLSPSYQITYAPIPPVLQVGSLPKNDVDVGTGLVGAPAYVSLSKSSFVADGTDAPMSSGAAMS